MTLIYRVSPSEMFVLLEIYVNLVLIHNLVLIYGTYHCHIMLFARNNAH
jgi:hypothetical protein